MELKKYTISVTESQYWGQIHNSLIIDSNEDGIPDRQINCSDCKEHSPTRGTYELTEEEALQISQHPHVKWIELDPSEYPDEYPKPDFATPRWGSGGAKVYRTLNTYGPVSSGATSGEYPRTNYGVIRSGIRTTGDYEPWTNLPSDGYVTTVPPVQGDVEYTLTGKNVDVIIHDSGVLQDHPEFIDDNGQSRVRDIVLDGPYYIDPDYFDNVIPGVKYTKYDGRVGIATTAAREWWTTSSKRSAEFSSVGTVSVPTNYTLANTIGIGTNGSSSLSSGHGTAAAGLVAGKNFGLAFESNIWNMSGIGDPTSITIEQNYDLMKIFHVNKPINPLTGKKDPTVINGSWGYQAAFSSSSTVTYKFRGSTGTFTGNASVTSQVTAMKDGLDNQVFGAYRSWSSSSRSNSTDTAANEMMDTGTIYVAAAGNNNQRLGVGSQDPDRLNYMSDNYFGSTDPRPEFPAGTVPCNHRDWMNPQGIGFNSTTDPEFHPVICVGAMEDYVQPWTGSFPGDETKATYSNNGPGIDVWAPADDTLSAGANGTTYADYQRVDNPSFYDGDFGGTSAASPVMCGLVALYMEMRPEATSREVKDWVRNRGSHVLDSTQYVDQYSDDTTTSYWTGSYNLRGAERRILFNPTANATKPTFNELDINGISFGG